MAAVRHSRGCERCVWRRRGRQKRSSGLLLKQTVLVRHECEGETYFKNRLVAHAGMLRSLRRWWRTLYASTTSSESGTWGRPVWKNFGLLRHKLNTKLGCDYDRHPVAWKFCECDPPKCSRQLLLFGKFINIRVVVVVVVGGIIQYDKEPQCSGHKAASP